MSDELRVTHGQPSAEELAALVAVLCARPTTPPPPTAYEAWRARRLATLRDVRLSRRSDAVTAGR